MGNNDNPFAVSIGGLTPEQIKLVAAQIAGGQPGPYKVFPDGMALWVYSMSFGKGRLCQGHVDDKVGYERGWCYESLSAAFKAADEWDGQGEPTGWMKNLQTQEYRGGP